MIVVPQGTDTVLLEATEQAGAEIAVPPLSVTPDSLLLKAMMQAGVVPPSSTNAAVLTGRVDDPPSTGARDRTLGGEI